MGTKSDSPKLTPAERLARKRAAARLRQQRCRARKRQTMLEKKREEVVRQRCAKLTHDPPRPPVIMRAVQHRPRSLFPSYKPLHSAEASSVPWVRQQMIKSTSEPIYNCVSFDSQKSLEESRNFFSREVSSPPRSPAQKAPIVVTPTNQALAPAKPTTLVRTLSEEKPEEEPLVSEEEAAVVAMLSLKAGSTSPASEKTENESKEPPSLPTQSPPREVVISHKPTTQASTGPGGTKPDLIHRNQHKQIVRPQQPRHMVPRLYDYDAYTYGPPMKLPPHSHRAQVPPGYFRVHAPLPPPHSHYARYHYHPPPRYVPYKYE